MVGESKISVVIPCYHSDSVIDGCIRSIVEKGEGIIDEVIVVDNSEKPIDYSLLKGAKEIKTDYVFTGKNLGFRNAVNIGVRRARNEIVVVSNPDILLTEEDTLLTLTVPFSESNVVACTFPVIVHSDRMSNCYHTAFAVPFLISYAEWQIDRLPPSSIEVQRFSGAFICKEISPPFY